MNDEPCSCQAHGIPCHRKRRTGRRQCSTCIERCGPFGPAIVSREIQMQRKRDRERGYYRAARS